jgi:uncharacterized protein
MRAITWVKARGAEFAEVDLSGGRLRAAGTAVGAEPLPYRLDYELDCAERYITRRLSVRAAGAGWRRHLELSRGSDGDWTARTGTDGEPHPGGLPAPGGDTAALRTALDCDLGLSPLTNTMPVLREGLLTGGEAEFLMAWISVPALQIEANQQRYTFVRRAGGGAVVRYQSGTFAADVTFDADGIVADYPGIGRLA